MAGTEHSAGFRILWAFALEHNRMCPVRLASRARATQQHFGAQRMLGTELGALYLLTDLVPFLRARLLIRDCRKPKHKNPGQKLTSIHCHWVTHNNFLYSEHRACRVDECCPHTDLLVELRLARHWLYPGASVLLLRPPFAIHVRGLGAVAQNVELLRLHVDGRTPLSSASVSSGEGVDTSETETPVPWASLAQAKETAESRAAGFGWAAVGVSRVLIPRI